ncbi:MAG: tandem-95 repeat protein, partial [Methylococcaceae bacterium]|nr:tandem-95 repeat protein [Methylococcaceae bacterium]
MHTLNNLKPHSTTTVFIDARVANLATLLPKLETGAAVITLNTEEHGLTQIAQVLKGQANISAVHILSHGSSGSLQLGNNVIDAEDLTAHAEELAIIRAALADNADLLVYGCHVAEGNAGQSFIKLLSEMTGAEVAASIDATGADALGGNWQLTMRTGAIKTQTLNIESWNSLLAFNLTSLTGTANAVGTTLGNTIVGQGVSVNTATYTGVNSQVATFSGGLSAGLGFDSGILLTTGSPANVNGANILGNQSTSVGAGSAGDNQLTTLGGSTTFDAAVLNMTFTPTENKITLQFTFGSEEYIEYVNGGFNDVMAVWVNGVQTAVIPPNNLPVTINNVNLASNTSLYKNNVPNAAGPYAYPNAMDGYTVTLELIANVTPNVSNTIKIAIADGGDASYDSYLFVRASSFESNVFAYNDVAITSVNTPVIINAIANDFDRENLPLNITAILDKPVTTGGIVTLPTGATVQLNNAGMLVYTPASGSTAPDIFTYTITDSAGNTAVAYVTTSMGANAAPVATAITASGNEDTSITVNLAGTDSDGTIASVNVATLPLASQGVLYKANGVTPVLAGGVAGSALTPAEAASLVFKPALNFNGVVAVPFTVVDNRGASSPSANATITVASVNDAPIATPITINASLNTSNVLNLTGTDVDGTIASVKISTLPLPSQGVLYLANGSTPVTAGAALTPAQAASLIFTPTLNFNGTITIPFTVTDNGGLTSVAANASIGVALPTATAVTINGTEDIAATVNLSGVDSNGTIVSVSVTTLPLPAQGILYQADGTTLVVAATALTPTQAANLVFKPALNFNGSLTFPFTVTDNDGLTSTAANVTLTLAAANDAPVANPATATGSEDAQVTLKLTGTDVDGTIASIKVTALPPVIQGVLYLADGSTPVLTSTVLTPAQATSLVFKPALNFNGTVTIPFTATDNTGLISTVTNAIVNITSVNDAPIATPATASGNKNIPIPLNLTGTDIDGTIASVSVPTLPLASKGVLYLADGTTAITAGATLTAAQAAGLIFKPALNTTGATTFTFTVTDDNGLASTAANATITVLAANTPPTATAITVNGTEDTQVTVNLAGTDLDGTISSVSVTTLPLATQGILYLANGTTAVLTSTVLTVAQAAGLVFKPVLNFNGTVTIPFTVKDNSAATSTIANATINLAAVNDAPVATSVTTSANKNVPISLNLTGTDIDGTIASVKVTTLPSASVGILYQADGTTIVVAGATLTPAQASSLIFIPALNYVGAATIPFTVTDNNGLASASVNASLTLLATNTPPIGNAITVNGTEDTQVTISLAATDADGTISTLSVTTLPLTSQGVLYLADGTTPVVAGAVLTPAQAANLVLKPALNFNGTFTIPFTATDNGGLTSAAANATLVIAAANDAPVATALTANGTEDAPVAFSLAGTDVDGTLASFNIAALPLGTQGILYLADGTTPVLAGASLTPAQAAGLVFVPALDFNGSVAIAFTATDNGGLTSAAANATLVIAAANDAPVATALTANGTEDAPVAFSLAGTDVDGTLASFNIAALPLGTQGILYLADGTTPVLAGASLTPAQAAGLVFVPALDFNGSVAIAFTATDNGGLTSAAANATLVIAAANDAPVATPITLYGNINKAIALNLTGTDSDGTLASVTLLTLPTSSEGILYLADGVTPVALNVPLTTTEAATLKFVPAPTYAGKINFNFTATDNNGTIAKTPATISINISFATIDLPAKFDSGSSNNDNNTNITTIDLQGYALAGSSVQITAPNGTILGTVITNAEGLWLMPAVNLSLITNDTGKLGDGVFTFNAESFNSAGVLLTHANPLVITLDTIAPDKPTTIIMTAATDLLGDNNPNNNSTNDPTPTFTINLPTGKDLQPDYIVKLYATPIKGGAPILVAEHILTALEVQTGSIDLTALSMGDGKYTFNAQIFDVAGNVKDHASFEAAIITDLDGIAPSVETAGSATGDFNGDGKLDYLQNAVATFPVLNVDGQLGHILFAEGNKAPTNSFGTLIVADLTNPAATTQAIVVDSNAQLQNVSVLGFTNPLLGGQTLPASMTAVTDLIQFTVTAIEGSNQPLVDLDPTRPGLQTRVVLEIPEGVIADTFCKFGPDIENHDQHFFEFLADGNLATYDDGAELFRNSAGLVTRVVITLTDNGIGDSDPRIGFIADPGHLALRNTSTTTPTPTGNETHIACANDTLIDGMTAESMQVIATVVPVVTAARLDTVTSANPLLADIPVVTNSNGEIVLQVSIPEHVGFTAEQIISPCLDFTLREMLMTAAESRIEPLSALNVILQQGIDQYLPTVADEKQVVVRTIIFNQDNTVV